MEDKHIGLIKSIDDYDIWFEPITDSISGFVIRNNDGSIKEIYTKDTNLSDGQRADLIMEHYQYPWKFHDMLTGISTLPTETEWIPVHRKSPNAEGFYTCLLFDCKSVHSFESEIHFDGLSFDVNEGCHVVAWTGHSHLRIIDNSTDFDKKMLRLVTEIASFLGEPEPFEIEKKFLIKYPDINILESLPNCQKVEILQMYLKSDNEDEVRIRQRGDGKDFIYTKTTKRTVTGLKRIKKEKNLTKEEYLKEMLNVDFTLNPIRKSRYCLSYLNTYIEIDIYPFWDNYAIMEIELADEKDSYQIPDFIHVIKEVTEDRSFKNVELAKRSINEAYLNGKIDCAHSCFKYMEEQCKNQKLKVEDSVSEYEKMNRHCHYEDEMSLVNASREDALVENAKLDAYVQIKISLEKWWKKIKHEKEENN
ncbi:hypothetical protein [Hungatella hathewayi]|uniref:hypothetical protein n=1 Tax=Hungatella hathewayi TaxID=154046 RepID=UPI003562D711